MSKPAEYVYCIRCGKPKAPRGRSVAMEMYSGMCHSDDCAGYNEEPEAECRWPGELVCGPGCTR